jgi:hypothetical protein
VSDRSVKSDKMPRKVDVALRGFLTNGSLSVGKLCQSFLNFTANNVSKSSGQTGL